jgi:hypothetical protein
MKKSIPLLSFLFIIFSSKSYSQDYRISQPKLEFDGRQLVISYDLSSKSLDDKFYVWVEVGKRSGEMINAKSFSGDVGDVKAGRNKKISWKPEDDSVFLNEEVLVEVKAERYIRSFSKGSALLLSTAVPGLGQTKLSRGKPWWLTGVMAYGALGGGFLVYQNSLKTYDSYKAQTDPSKRTDLLNKSQKQMNTSGALFISGAALWAVNILWVAVTPAKYEPLQHVKISLNQPYGSLKSPALLTLQINF